LVVVTVSSTVDTLVINGNPRRQSVTVQNLDAMITIYIRLTSRNTATTSTSNYSYQVLAQVSFVFQKALDGLDAGASIFALAASGSPSMSAEETI
jgi:hypothetical protein